MAPFATLLLVTLFSLLSTIAHSDHHLPHPHIGETKIKSLHFTLYLHETINSTAYFVVKGVAGPTGYTASANPFGSVVAFNDVLTETPNPSSKVLGTIEGVCVTSSFDGARTTCPSTTSLNLKGYKGQLQSVGTGQYTKVSELPFVGGTEDFRFIQGYMILSAFDLSGPTTCYRIDYHLYWPPYATLLH